MIPINKLSDPLNSLTLAVNRRLSVNSNQESYGFLDDSVYKTYLNEETGDSEHDLVFSPNVQYHNISPDNIHWSIMGTDSNFKGTVDHQTFAEIELLPGYNLQNSNFKVSYLQEGEVFFAKLICYLLEGYEVNSNNEFVALDGTPEEHRKILHLESNYVIYRGYPINTKSAIYTNKNGTLNRHVFYTSPIEMEILNANSGDPFFVYDNRPPNHASSMSLSEFIESIDPNVDRGRELFWDLDENATATLKKVGLDGNIYQNKIFQKSKISLIDDELGMYSHGRGLDIDSIATLRKQNPANFKLDKKVPPSDHLVGLARENRINQLPGFSAIDIPLTNPNLSSSTDPESGNISSSNSKIYIPGRSSHATVWEKKAFKSACGTVTFEASGTASTSIYDGHTCDCSQEICFDIFAECEDHCYVGYDACAEDYTTEDGRYSGEYSHRAVFGPEENLGDKYTRNSWNSALTDHANLMSNCEIVDVSLWASTCGQGVYDPYGNTLDGGGPTSECYDSYWACCVENHAAGGIFPRSEEHCSGGQPEPPD